MPALPAFKSPLALLQTRLGERAQGVGRDRDLRVVFRPVGVLEPRSPAEARAVLLAEARRRHFRSLQRQAEREVQLVADVEAREVAQGVEGPAGRGKSWNCPK